MIDLRHSRSVTDFQYRSERIYLIQALKSKMRFSPSKMSRRRRVSVENKLRNVREHRAMEDYQHLADQLGINRSTAQTIVSIAMRQPRQHRWGTRGGRRNVKVDDDMRRVIEDILGGNPAITLCDLNAELRRRMPDKPQACDTLVVSARRCSSA